MLYSCIKTNIRTDKEIDKGSSTPMNDIIRQGRAEEFRIGVALNLFARHIYFRLSGVTLNIRYVWNLGKFRFRLRSLGVALGNLGVALRKCLSS